MTAQTQFRPQVIEALTVLWRALPPRGVTDERGTMVDYCFALADCSAEAVYNTVNNLRAGKIEEASKSFCPKAPELAVLVRSEQARIDAVNRPKSIPYQAPPRDYLVHVVKQRQKANELAAQGFRCIATGVDHPMSLNMTKKKERGVGSIWFASLQEVWEPPHV
ncbi:hypothetical protein AGRHK599_LOCUS1237 [Rhizobium rhizogenes]|uniref:Uncharacterized protein n=1 Tax=Rhizobium rhizogenes TaxID=359 RepID=A0AAN2A1J3_RHIRH|nr:MULTISPECIES: hypothetical protein [Rhizobium/Agrobacterium group]MCZ7443010.1 hypothetical protein [Rhizobium rhizogenes]NSZ78996.1 hypothetical protein [Agrobacterium tumefaciens]CAD0211211.1 hypothetical protein AGRHK599_LOCUS1237 [Rhizobium rhizogenes]